MNELRFACDAMLGRLARWLRLAGFDTLFEAANDDAGLAALSRSEGRWLLTRDRALASVAGPRVVLVRAATVADQVEELRRRLPLAARRADWFTRCPRCNGSLRPAPRGEVAEMVPPYVAAHADSFRRCSRCGQVYWPGTHGARIATRLTTLFGAEGALRRRDDEGGD